MHTGGALRSPGAHYPQGGGFRGVYVPQEYNMDMYMHMNTIVTTTGYGHFKVSYVHPSRRRGFPVMTGKGSTRRWDKAKAERSGRSQKVVWYTA